MIELFLVKWLEECFNIGINFSVLRLLGDDNSNRGEKFIMGLLLFYRISSIFGDEKIIFNV